jgi:energy-coupling factor transporter ATP-binding protein EcfA2
MVQESLFWTSSKPSIPCCCAGLDARAAAIVMKAVKAVAAGGHTVMVTIHQPSINIFEAFDQLLLLQRGGRVAYFGPLGERSSALVHYMESVPGQAAACLQACMFDMHAVVQLCKASHCSGCACCTAHLRICTANLSMHVRS